LKKGDRVLLLNYRNDPYRIVYDVLKVIDDNNAIGVMHLGDFPNGVEFATFVMSRHNYPFENFSVQDHREVFADSRTRTPRREDLVGRWEGRLVSLANPNASLANQVNPVLFSVDVAPDPGRLAARCRFGLFSEDKELTLTPESERISSSDFQEEIRVIDSSMVIGKWVFQEPSPGLLLGLQAFVEPGRSGLIFYFILKRQN